MKIKKFLIRFLIRLYFMIGISYIGFRMTYYFFNDFDLQVSISVSVLTNNEVTQIFGGSYFFEK